MGYPPINSEGKEFRLGLLPLQRLLLRQD